MKYTEEQIREAAKNTAVGEGLINEVIAELDALNPEKAESTPPDVSYVPSGLNALDIKTTVKDGKLVSVKIINHGGGGQWCIDSLGKHSKYLPGIHGAWYEFHLNAPLSEPQMKRLEDFIQEILDNDALKNNKWRPELKISNNEDLKIHLIAFAKWLRDSGVESGPGDAWIVNSEVELPTATAVRYLSEE